MTELEKYLPRCRIFLLDGEKFRTNLTVLFFDLPLRRESVTKTALLAECLKKYAFAEAAEQAEKLYGALWDISVVKKGERQLLLFSLETLKMADMAEALVFLRERIFLPSAEGFSVQEVERQKKVLRRKFAALQDDKKVFARRRAMEETAAGTAYAVSADGYAEDLDGIDTAGLLAWYREILHLAEVKIFFCGDRAERAKVLSLRQDFAGGVSVQERKETEMKKEPPRFLRERVNMEQARLILGFAAEAQTEYRQAALALLHQLLGGSPDSILFRRLREEQGLCYDVSSYQLPLCPYLFLQAGIQKENARQAAKEMFHAVEILQEEEISAEKLYQAKKMILRRTEALSDDPWGMTDYFAERALQGKSLSTEAFLRQVAYMEAADIRQAAKHLEWKTLYLLEGREDTHAEK